MNARLEGRRTVDGLLKAISGTTRRRLIGAISCAYAIPVVVYAICYRLLGCVSSDEKKVADIGRALYFSLVTQATVGFGDLVPSSSLGRLLVGSQVVIGVAWTAFLPAVALIRLTQPDSGSLFLSEKVAFDPESGRFAIRYASFSRLTVFHLDVTAWVRVLSPRVGEYNNNPIKIRSSIMSIRRFANLRTKVPFIIYTDPASVEPVFPEHVADIELHPAHLERWSDERRKKDGIPVMVDIAGDTTIGPVHVHHEYRYHEIVCGTHVNVQKDPEGPQDWSLFDLVVLKDSTPDGKEYCRKCRFQPTCGLINKVRSDAE